MRMLIEDRMERKGVEEGEKNEEVDRRQDGEREVEKGEKNEDVG